MIKAKNTYKIPLEDAIWIIKKATGNPNVNMSGVHGAILCGIKLFLHDHPSVDLPNLNGSLAKRIVIHLKKFYTRLLADKYMINWLATHRIDLSKLEGEFRRALLNEIKKELKP